MASTKESTLFSAFLSGGYGLVIWELHLNIRGVNIRRLCFEGGKRVVGYKNDEFVSVAGAARFGALCFRERHLYTQQGGSYGVHSVYDDQSACEIDYGMC